MRKRNFPTLSDGAEIQIYSIWFQSPHSKPLTPIAYKTHEKNEKVCLTEKRHKEIMKNKHTVYLSDAVSRRVSRASKSQVFFPCTEKKELHPSDGSSSAAICHIRHKTHFYNFYPKMR